MGQTRRALIEPMCHSNGAEEITYNLSVIRTPDEIEYSIVMCLKISRVAVCMWRKRMQAVIGSAFETMKVQIESSESLHSVPVFFSASMKQTVPSSLETAKTFFPPLLDSVKCQRWEEVSGLCS